MPVWVHPSWHPAGMTSRVPEFMSRLKDHCAAVGAPIADLLRPGVSAEDLNKAEAQLGFQLPIEVRDWFMFHNGVANIGLFSPATFPNRASPFGLGSALDRRHELLSVKYPIPELIPDDQIFQPTWLPIDICNNIHTVLDCGNARNNPQLPAPVHMIIPGSEYSAAEARLPSLTAMLEIWLQLCESGAWYYDVEDGIWDERYDLIPEALQDNPAIC